MLHLHFAIDNICSQFRRFLISVLLVTASLILLILTVMFYDGMNYGYTTADDILEQGIDGTGMLTIDTFNQDSESIEKLMLEAYESENISAIGCINESYVPMIEDLFNIQKENKIGYFVPSTEEGYISAVEMDVKTIEICQFELSKGKLPSELEFSEDKDAGVNEISYLYLGSAYNSIEVGTEYTMEYMDGHYVVKYIVAGIMEEGQEWIDPGIIPQFSIGTLDNSIDCTYGIFEIQCTLGSTDNFIFSAEEGYTIDEAMDTVRTLAEKYGIEISGISLEEQYEIENESFITILSYLKETFTVVIPAIILMLITMQIVSIILELKSYGILYSIGFGLKDINFILIIKNIVLAVTGLAIAIPVVLWFANRWFEQDMQYIMKTVLLTSALPVAIVVLMTVIAVTSITAVLVLRHYKPVELMRIHS